MAHRNPSECAGTQPDGVENVFLLPVLRHRVQVPNSAFSEQNSTIFLSNSKRAGRMLIFVADTCFGGGMTRDIDPRSEEMSFRQVPTYQMAGDQLQPVATASDETADRS